MKKLFQNLKVKAATGSLLLSLKLNNIQRLLFYLLILFIPTQFGRHFWPDFSLVSGIRVDYLSPTPYVTDILIFLIFVFWIASTKKFLISNFPPTLSFPNQSGWRAGKFSILIFATCLIIGVVLSKSPQAGIYGLLKLLEFIFLGFYIVQNISKFKLENILLMFAIGIIFESFLSISQYFNHGSLQGIFYFFGERFFTSLTPGIANASLGGELFLRPYGTFPHPNVLSGYLLIGMMLIISNFIPPLAGQISNMKKILYCIILLIGTIALFLTLSRIAILLWSIILVFYFVRKFILHTSYFLILIFGVILILSLATPLGARFTQLKLTDESIVYRESLIRSSIAMIKDHPIFGVGLNNFLVNLPSYQIPHTPLFYLQPVHNIYLLILSETGIAGFLIFIWFVIKTVKRIKNHESRVKRWSMIHNSLFIILLTSVLTLGMFDHYFLTLQQGQLLFSFVLGLCWSKSPKRNV